MKEMFSKINKLYRMPSVIKLILVVSLLFYSPINAQTNCPDEKQCFNSSTSTCLTIGENAGVRILKDTKTGFCFTSDCGANRCYDSKTFYCYELEGKIRQVGGSCGDICDMNSCNGGNNICVATSASRLREFKTASCVLSCPTNSSPAQCLISQIGFNCKEVSSASNSRRSTDSYGTCVDVCLEGNCFDERFVCNAVGVNRWRQVVSSACNTSCLGASCKPNSTSFVCQSTSGTNFKKADGFCATACPLTECISDVANRICSLNSNNPLTVRRFEDGVCASSCSFNTCFTRESNFNCRQVNAQNRRELSSICSASCTENSSCLENSIVQGQEVISNICVDTLLERKRHPNGKCFYNSTCPSGTCLVSSTTNYCSYTSSSNVREINSSCSSACSENTCYTVESTDSDLDKRYHCRNVSSGFKKELNSGICNASCTGNSCDDGTNVCKALSIAGTIRVRISDGTCASSCTETGYCYLNDGVCVTTNSGRIKDINSKCGSTCSGNTCWTSTNSFTCVSNGSNFKSHPSHECAASCSGNTCHDSGNSCISTNPKFRLPDGNCSPECSGSTCISSVANYLCSNTGINNYKDVDKRCNTQCTGNYCFDASDYICVATQSNKFKNNDSACVTDCSANYCKTNDSSYRCLANAPNNVRRLNGFCASLCPSNECSPLNTYSCISTNPGNHRNSNDGVCVGVCEGANCWTSSGYNCEPTSKLRFKELSGECNTHCSNNSCLDDTYDFVCQQTSATKVKSLDGSCKVQCEHGSCYVEAAGNDNFVCFATRRNRIRDVSGKCGTTCSGNSCFSPNNDFSCTATDEFNYKQLDGSCNAFCMGNSCTSQNGEDAFVCLATNISLFKNTNYDCVSDCPEKTCLDSTNSKFWCLNTNPKRVRSIDNSCASACSGDLCFNGYFHCEALDINKRAMNGSCTSICQSPQCDEGGSSCIQASALKLRKSDGTCSDTCNFDIECSSNDGNFLCNRLSEHVLGQPDNTCGTNCPIGKCYKDDFKCQAYSGFIANINGKCISSCNVSQCFNRITEHCFDLSASTPNRLRDINGYCVSACNWNTECYDNSLMTCKNMINDNLVQDSNNVCASECADSDSNSFSRCFDSATRKCRNSSPGNLRTSSSSSVCLVTCPTGSCYNSKFICESLALNSSTYDDTTTQCFNNCGTLTGKCIEGDICRNTSNSLFKLPDGNCTSIAQCGTGFCIDPMNTRNCLATSITNVKRSSDGKCNFTCEVGDCYDNNNECVSTSAVTKVRNFNGKCETVCDSRYYLDSNNHCLYTDYDHVILPDNSVGTVCPDGYCMEAASNRLCILATSNNINDNGICNTTCSEDKCYDSSYNCVSLSETNTHRRVDGSCNTSCGDDECISETIDLGSGNFGYKCTANSFGIFKSPHEDNSCLSQCPPGYCYNNIFACIIADASNYRNIVSPEIGKCDASCLGASCKSMNVGEYLCLSTTNDYLLSPLRKENATANCITSCGNGFCADNDGVCQATSSSNFADVNGNCSNSCTGATCANADNNWKCSPTTSSFKKSSDGTCVATCSADSSKCFDLDYICRASSSSKPVDFITLPSKSCGCQEATRCVKPGFDSCIRPSGNDLAVSESNSCVSSSCGAPGLCRHPFRNYCSSVLSKNPDNDYCEVKTRITYIGYFSDFIMQKETDNKVNSYHYLNFLTTSIEQSDFFHRDFYFSIIYKDGTSAITYSDTKYHKYYDLYSKHLTLDNTNNFVVFYDFKERTVLGDNDYYSVYVKAIIASCEDDAIEIYNALPSTVTKKVIVHPNALGFEFEKDSITYSQGSTKSGKFGKGIEIEIESNFYSFEDILTGDLFLKDDE